MSKSSHNTGGHEAAECRQHIEDLQEELQAAMAAIAQNSLVDLELSLWRQEMLCVALHRSAGELKHSVADRESLSRLHSAAQSLQALNRTYDRLVRQSSRSAAFLLGLSCFYKGGVPAALLPHFSCEA
jgi:hypothetical protein